MSDDSDFTAGDGAGAGCRPEAAAVAGATFTPGPWEWFGEAGHNNLYLATNHSGRRFVMQFARWGMRGAQPRFQTGGRMVDASELLTFEVCEAVGVSAANKDPACYRLSVEGINHPDALLMRAAPDLFEALQAAFHEGYEELHPATAAKCRAAISRATGATATTKVGTPPAPLSPAVKSP